MKASNKWILTLISILVLNSISFAAHFKQYDKLNEIKEFITESCKSISCIQIENKLSQIKSLGDIELYNILFQIQEDVLIIKQKLNEEKEQIIIKSKEITLNLNKLEKEKLNTASSSKYNELITQMNVNKSNYLKYDNISGQSILHQYFLINYRIREDIHSLL